MSYAKHTWVNDDLTKPLNATRLGEMEDGIYNASSTADTALSLAQANSTGVVGAVALDSFGGSTDDAKLDAALSYVSAQTYKPPILFGNRLYSFTANRNTFAGLKLIGPFGQGNQHTSKGDITHLLKFSGTGTWWTMPATQHGTAFIGLSTEGNSSSTFFATAAGATMWTSLWRDLGFNTWKGVLGNSSSKVLIDAVTMSGYWNINVSYDTAINLGGSDNQLFTDGLLIDSNAITAGRYHLICNYLEKTTIGAIYMTSDVSGGIYVTGNETNGQLIFTGARDEGRNTNTPCHGSNVRIDGGGVTFRDCWISYGATALNTNGRTGELGVITVTGGRALFDGCWYDRAAGVAEAAPWIGQSGGFVRVRNSQVATGGGTWTSTPGKPRIHSTGGTYDVDSSMVVV